MTFLARRALLAVLAGSLLAAPQALAADPARLAVPVDVVDTVTPGALSVAPAAEGSWQVGGLTVTLSAADGLVVHEDGRTVWAAQPGGAFVAGGRGSVSWEENRGYFWPTVTYADRLTEQTIEAVDATAERVVLSGFLTGALAEPATWSLTVAGRAEGGASLDLATDSDDPLTSVVLESGRSDGAGVHGFGEQFTDFDLDGRLLPIVVREQGVGRGEQPITAGADLTQNGAGGTEAMTYAAWPSYVTEDLRGLRLAADAAGSHAFAVADTRDPGAVALEAWAPTMAAEVSSADSPADLVAAQQQGDTRPPLERWATRGAIVGLQGGTKEVRRELRVLTDAGAKVSAVWLQDWTGRRVTSFGSRLWWTWQRDRELYPRWRRLLRDLARQGIRTTTYVNPFLVDAGAKGEPGLRNLWAEARDQGYLVEHPDGGPYLLDQGEFEASLVDLTEPAARSWFSDVIAEEVLAHGVSGFMADFAEGLPFDAVLHDGAAADLHNRWPTLWAETVQEGCERAGVPECVTWFRSGGLGQAAHAPLFWNGDQLVTWSPEDGLASALLGTLSAGVSGWPLVHSDVGGYTTVADYGYVRTPELLARWAEYQAFGVVMRTHEGNQPEANTQVFSDPATARRFARMTRLFAALRPYRRAVVREATRTGVPAVRPGWLVVPGTAAADEQDQFFLGAHLLVAPVLEEGAREVSVTLPPGRWVHLLTGERYAGGGEATVPARLGRPAAFLRAGDPWIGRLRERVERAGF